MKKVITYGSFDLFHHGHQRLLERAKALGDFLIVGITSDDYDNERGKINKQQSLAERIASVKATGLADKIIIEEYDGQKIDDIKKNNIDIFTVGSDWTGKFDYLKKYCKVVYLDRTVGISSSQIRSEQRHINVGLVGESYDFLNKIITEGKFVNGLDIKSIYSDQEINEENRKKMNLEVYETLDELLKNVDAVYVKANYEKRYQYIKKALKSGKHVLCESPICLNHNHCIELFEIAKQHNCVLLEAIRTAYTTAYKRMALLAEIGKIGDIVSIHATCTNMTLNGRNIYASLYEWGPNALLPVFQLLGTKYKKKFFISRIKNKEDAFTEVNFIFDHSMATITVAEGAKSEGSLVISGTQGYIYVPAPWWKTEYFELRFENSNQNRRYFYQLDGEGIRHELVEFLQAIKDQKDVARIDRDITLAICKVMEDFNNKKDLYII